MNKPNTNRDERDRMLEIIWRENKPKIFRPVDETIPKYNIDEIYDNPTSHMTIRGIFRYAGVEMIL